LTLYAARPILQPFYYQPGTHEIMKFFRKNKTRSVESRPRTAVPTPDHFYSQHAGESPLDEYSDGADRGPTCRTSQHSPARIRENSNRASNWAISLLLLRAVLIVVLLVGGFIVLKLVLDRMAEPSEKELLQREATSVLMETPSVSGTGSAGAAGFQELVVDTALIGQRLEQWEQAERHLRSAEALTRRGIDEEAIQQLGQALRTMPDSREAQKLLLELYMKKGFYAEAVPLCIRLLDQDSRQKDLQMTLLSALQSSGQTAAGLLLADRILQVQPNNMTVLSFAAVGQLGLGNKEAAQALFERILENDDKNTDALEGCAKIYSEQGNYQKAVPYYLELVRLNPKPAYYQELARCYAQQNQADKAVALMGQAASLFGETAVSPWLRDTIFDPVRETVEFRSFADRLVGVETRKAIEAINKREVEKAEPTILDGRIELPKQPDLQTIRPGN
jgi:tetratricopeptide (TPR) repeat protein